MERSELRKAGLKVTLPRMRVLTILEGSGHRHMSAEDIYKSLLDSGEDIGLATVYRVLTQFETAGLVSRHNFEGGHSIFELDTGVHHDHIVCNDCGRIEEFMNPVIETQQEQIAKEHGFSLAAHSMILYGRCLNPDCPHLDQK